MNLDSLTPDQRESVQHVTGPLLVSAGAGSGKTFTLTQRIAYAFLEESGPAIQDIDEVLAITFTEKAAAEIKARVKATLRQNGLFEQALKVDSAWISTIHGMCSRILRTHALELGVDPGFDILSECERDDMLTSCINEELSSENEIIGAGAYGALFDEYKARSSMMNDTSIESMIRGIVDKAAGLRKGMDAFCFGPEPEKPTALARELLIAYEEVLPALEQGGSSQAAESAREAAAGAIERLEAFLASSGSATDIRVLAEAIEGCKFLPRSFGGAEVKEAVAAYQQEHARIDAETVLAIAYPLANLLVGFASKVRDRYECEKRAAGMLDNDDLLLKTLQAFEDHPEIADRYASQFKLVMVDEFQDTNQVQIDLIGYLAGGQSEHLCTVGDSQQSIYRFRGADVAVYEAHKRTMRSDGVGALCKELTKNFRSHGDILSLVDRVFEQASVFGDQFMSLAPDETRMTSYRADLPRINMVLASLPSGTKTGLSVRDAKLVEARAIAQRFSQMRDAGHSAGEMVVLLGKMSRAGMYAQALRDEGFECVIAGGTLFDKALEVRTIARFVEVLANQRNSAALFEVLTSDMIRLSADELLELSTTRDRETGQCTRRDVSAGFLEISRSIEQGDTRPGISKRLVHAVRLFETARGRLTHQSVSQVVLQSVIDSGWISRLEREGAVGTAVAANILKAIRMIGDLESRGHKGIASLAKVFSDQITLGMKESPGALSGDQGGVVKIMTIHASKGLEFPIVAVADFYDDNAKTEKLEIETKDGRAYLSLEPGESLAEYSSIAAKKKNYRAPFEEEGDPSGAALGLDFDGCASQADYRALLKAYAHAEELAESRRKFYVALTRASEALVIAMTVKEGKPDDSSRTYKGVIEDIRTAFFPGQDFPQGVGQFDYRGSQPGMIERIAVTAEEDDSDGDHVDRLSGEFCIPCLEASGEEAFEAYSPLRKGVFSYSSIAEEEEDASQEQASTQQKKMTRQRGESAPQTADGEKATDLGTAFHRLAQFAIERGELPDRCRIAALSRSLALSETQQMRLGLALDRWFSSEVYKEVRGNTAPRAEVPFFVSIEEAFMEGEIDLLCVDEQAGKAFIVDYKTGQSDKKTAVQLHKKHRLQAECYAYATLLQGFSSVELRFVRVECADPDDPDQPQVVTYTYDSEDVPVLEQRILHAFRRKRG